MAETTRETWVAEKAIHVFFIWVYGEDVLNGFSLNVREIW